MPGFYGLVAEKGVLLDAERLFRSMDGRVHLNPFSFKGLTRFTLPDAFLHLGIESLHEGLTRLDQPKALPAVFYEGYIYEIAGIPTLPKTRSDMSVLLRDLYLKEGAGFAKGLRGSFTLFILEESRFSLATDQTCSRPIHVYHSPSTIAWSPEILPLVVTFKEQLTLNLRNLGQVLCSEFSFPDDTLFNEILFLRPGEIFTYDRGKITRSSYFRFRYDEERFDSGFTAGKRLARKLNQRAAEVIRLQWAMAKSPAILLSGGLDSRYVLSVIADMVEDTTKLTLVTWTVPQDKPFSDLDIARRIARRLGAKHLILQRNLDRVTDGLAQMYELIGCEVDSLFHVTERALIALLREEHGIESIFRGEESFGWGEYRRCLKSALNQIIVSYPEDNPLLNKVLWPEVHEHMIRTWAPRLREILEEYHQKTVNNLKDSLYFNWRLARYLNTLSYFKMAYAEQFNPLLDVDVLGINRITPSRLRLEKAILRKAYRLGQGTMRGIPFATRNSLENWEEVLCGNDRISGFVRSMLTMEDRFFQSAGHILSDFAEGRISKMTKDETGPLYFFKYSPRVKHHPAFKLVNMIRHFFVRPPEETMQVKLIFRIAMVKDFLHRYWY
jgi:asparagine synthetase B (glutamine-hydrolysing)